MPKKKPDPAVYLRHQKSIWAGNIKDHYPKVKSLTFELNHRDHDNRVKPSSRTFTRSLEDSAFFDFECPYDKESCFGGGHDLTQPISDMIENQNSECSGRILCQGDQRRHGAKHSCWCELTYKITVIYND